MNDRMRDHWYPKVVWKLDSNFGPYCRGCSCLVFKNKGKGRKQGIIDHINNKFENKLSNLQLLCKACNRIKNPKKQEKESLGVMTHSEIKNLKTETRFRGWVFNRMLEEHEIDVEDLRDAGAEKFSCSPETTRKYLQKLCSSVGPYELIRGTVCWKNDEELRKREEELFADYSLR